ncbi:unannotated protein [freshwater metagenome]|uniref:Unannotated protein n=1 Tax=freshwater metagenome TaxID=449393 RepID=A0A6J7GXB6_9ZZZZ|nr:S8 family serine peptidase [Actinomycetota bacterium]
MIRFVQKKSIVAFAIFGILFGSMHVAQAANSNTATERYILSFSNDDDVQGESNSFRSKGIKIHQTYTQGFKGVVGDFTTAQINDLKKNPKFLSAEKDGPVYATAISNPASVQTPAVWGLDRLDQRSASPSNSYSYTSNGQGVTAYVIDTGILATHEEFAGRVSPGNTQIADGNGTRDCNGHGTHVSGTIGGTKYGVAKGVTLVPVRVLDCTGSGFTSGVIAGINWVITNHVSGPAVANISLGGGFSAALNNAVAALVADGVVVAVAAGNDNRNACSYSPASAPNAITVGATDSTDRRANFSNFGTCLDIFAPGVGITSSVIGSNIATAVYGGTSMASPHVAGAAALLLEATPTATPAQIQSALVTASTCAVVTDAVTGSPNRLLATSTAGAPIVCSAPATPSAPSVAFVTTPRPRTLSVSVSTANNGGAAIQSYTLKIWTARNATSAATTLYGTYSCTSTSLTATCTITTTANGRNALPAGFYAASAIAVNGFGSSGESAKSAIVQVR